MLAQAKYIGAVVACSGLIDIYGQRLVFIIFGTIVSLLAVIHFSKTQKILNVANKVVGIAASGTFLYQTWVKGNGSGSDNDDKNKDNKDKKTNNKDNGSNNESNKK